MDDAITQKKSALQREMKLGVRKRNPSHIKQWQEEIEVLEKFLGKLNP